MDTARVELPVWDCTVSVVDGRLCAGRSPSDEDDDGELIPVDFLCTSFLRDASHALGVDFTADEFDVVACDGCRRQDEHARQVAESE